MTPRIRLVHRQVRGMVQNVTEALSTARSRYRRFLQLRSSLRAGWDKTEFALLDRWIEKEPRDPKPWVLRALAFKKAGKIHDASLAWRRAVALHPQNDDLVVLLANLAREQQNEDDELWALHQALFVRPEQQALLTRLFTLLVRKGDMATALVIADRLVALSPDYEPHLLRRAGCLVEVGRVAEAQAVLSQLVAKPGATWAVHLWLAKSLARSDRPIEAIAALTRAAELAPYEPTIWHELAVVQRHVGLAADSQASFTRSLELDPNNPSALRIAGYEHTYRYGDAPFQRDLGAGAHSPT